MPREYDVLVVGCSAVGALAARDLARAGLRTLVLEEHARPGKGGACTALVSRRGLRELGVHYAPSVVNEVRGARFHFGRAEFEVSRPASVACVLDRQRFDEECAREARNAGARILLKHQVTAIKECDGGASGVSSVSVYCGAKRERFHARYVIGADGAASTTAALYGFPPLSRFVLGYEAEFDGARVAERDFVHLFFARAFPGFFAWLVPSGARKARAGFGVKDFKGFTAAKRALYSLDEVARATGGAQKTREYSALVPLKPRAATQRGRVLLVGDAAGQTKASSGGGLVFGGLCARLAAQCVARAIERGEPLEYEREWRERCGKTLALHFMLRAALDFGGDAALAALFALGRAGGGALASRVGDMDFIVELNKF